MAPFIFIIGKKKILKTSLFLLLLISFSVLKAFNSSFSLTNGEKENTIKLLFAGDVRYLPSNVNFRIKTSDQKTEFEGSFDFVKNIITKSDLAFANINTLFSVRSSYSNNIGVSPEILGITLKDIGVDIFTVANEAMLKKGKAGIRKTLKYFHENNLDYIGIYDLPYEKNVLVKPLIVTSKGYNIGILNYTLESLPSQSYMSSHTSYFSKELFYNQIDFLKQKNVDFVICFLKWGKETKYFNDQKEFMNFLSDNNVNIVIGYNPYEVGKIDFQSKNNRLFAYSLGTFISTKSEGEEGGILLEVDIGSSKEDSSLHIKDVGYYITWIHNSKNIYNRYTVVPNYYFADKKNNFLNKKELAVFQKYLDKIRSSINKYQSSQKVLEYHFDSR